VPAEEGAVDWRKEPKNSKSNGVAIELASSWGESRVEKRRDEENEEWDNNKMVRSRTERMTRAVEEERGAKEVTG